MKKAKLIGLSLVLLLVFVSAVASASDSWPGWFKRGAKDSRGIRGTATPGQTNGTVSVAEPAAIALLGAGLVSLGIYAKRKRSKKR